MFRFSSVQWLGITSLPSNTFTLWLLHTVTEAGLARLIFEEWRLLRQYTERLTELEIKKLSEAEISCAEYQEEVLAVGLRSGAVRLYQPARQVRSEGGHTPYFLPLITPDLFLQFRFFEFNEGADRSGMFSLKVRQDTSSQ